MPEENKRKFEEAPKTTLLSAMKVLKSGKLLLWKKNPFLPILLTGRHGGAGVSTVTSQQEVFLIRTRSSLYESKRLHNSTAAVLSLSGCVEHERESPSARGLSASVGLW